MAGEQDAGVSLPEDMIFDVLARLPAKTLCRLRCVCKAWRDLISDSFFIAVQKSYCSPHLVGLFFGGSRNWPPEVRVMDMDGNVVRMLEVRPLGKDDGNHIFSVQQQQATTQLNVIVRSTAMIIDPAVGRASTVDTGRPSTVVTRTIKILSSFARASPSGALKVFCLQKTVSNQLTGAVATIVDGGAEPRWRKRSAPPFGTSWYLQRTATVNGVVYFMPPPRDDSDYATVSSGSQRIVAFDLESEEWKMVNSPPFQIPYGTRYITLALTELKGTLAFVQFQREDGKHYYVIVWRLIGFDKSVWIKDCTIQMPKTWKVSKLLGALDDGTILLLVSKVENKHDKTRYDEQVLVFYNPDTKTFKNHINIPMDFDRDVLVLYTGSLLSCS